MIANDAVDVQAKLFFSTNYNLITTSYKQDSPLASVK